MSPDKPYGPGAAHDNVDVLDLTDQTLVALTSAELQLVRDGLGWIIDQSTSDDTDCLQLLAKLTASLQEQCSHPPTYHQARGVWWVCSRCCKQLRLVKEEVKPLVPADRTKCQAVIYQPFVMGGKVTRQCEAPPSWIVTELKPGKDGRTGEMSLCKSCRAEFYKRMGTKGYRFFKIGVPYPVGHKTLQRRLNRTGVKRRKR